MHSPPSTLDGYRLIRPIGRGGFGEVWLCQSEALGDFRALKILSTHEPGRLEREFEALCQFRAAAHRLKTPSLLSIEHVNRHSDTLFYVMPLCDGVGGRLPSDADWRPLTLSVLIEQRKQAPAWFSPAEVCQTIIPLLQAIQLLSDAGLVHRDVKPDNILFLDGRACLADIGLLGDDAQDLTRRGTPGYAAPSWYLESGGHPDMYGVAATLYVMLTGNAPDKIGRSAFRWPPHGENSLDLPQREELLRLHQIIRRAMDERPAERFADFTALERALQANAFTPTTAAKSRFNARTLALVCFTIGIGFAVFELHKPRPNLSSPPDVFLQAIEQTRQQWVPSREFIRKQVDGVVEELSEILNHQKDDLPGITQRLSEIDLRVKTIAQLLPAKPDIGARRDAIEQLRAQADQISQSSGATLREPMDRQIRDLEWQFSTEKDFRMEQATRFMTLAIRILNAHQSVSFSPQATSAMIWREAARDKAAGSKKEVREWALSIYKTGQQWAFAP